MKDIIKIKEDLDAQKTKRDRLAGQLDQITKKLKELGYSFTKAVNRLEVLNESIDELDTNLHEKLEDFNTKYSELL